MYIYNTGVETGDYITFVEMSPLLKILDYQPRYIVSVPQKYFSIFYIFLKHLQQKFTDLMYFC